MYERLWPRWTMITNDQKAIIGLRMRQVSRGAKGYGGFLCRRTGSIQKAESKYALILFHYYSMQWLIFWTKVTKFTGLVNRPASKEYVAPAFAWPWRVHSPTGDVQQSEAPTKARIAGRMEIPKFWDFIGINRKFCISIEGNLQIWDCTEGN